MGRTIDLKNLRFAEADWGNNYADIVIGGAGTIGSNLCPIVSRLGHSIYLYDMDIVEEHNLGVQLFQSDSVGESKVKAVSNLTFKLSGNNISVFNEKYTSESMASNIMISCFDNMEARKIMFNNWLDYIDENPDDDCLFIDGRMDFTQFQVYFVTKDNIEGYKKTLFNDSEVDDVPCSLKTTPFIGPMIAGVMASGLCNFIANINCKSELYNVPFQAKFLFSMLIMDTNDKP